MLETLEVLRNSLGKQFDHLSQEARLILVTAQIEKTVDHSRMIGMMDIRPHDLTSRGSGVRSEGLGDSSGG
ncbi:hypothetical protein HTZ97_06535 [Desulfuromonas acetoxidans]|uniref:hypothetical protein n=1 Tax=Desulfuromonas acetoxidans TaxID=891 RepID=UPI000306EFCF|nr:hypothetical protein [Desulfuromonas acetoxidans]NVD23498.1 hypothetical protein [Desulfuromonas acetoxidans]NVE16116.1 hypothetical protein [Desulfuromonas acetoxidans]